ncbi:hypothetical protein [Bdellovibrio sp.]|uniref:hypothetical protein n=1 Tax=Bdellovibrio sp. TaxID=28201 RepID=UPI0039E237CD
MTSQSAISQRLRNDKGLSMVEALIGLAIVLMGAVAVSKLSILVSHQKGNIVKNEKAKAIALATVSHVAGLDYQSIVDICLEQNVLNQTKSTFACEQPLGGHSKSEASYLLVNSSPLRLPSSEDGAESYCSEFVSCRFLFDSSLMEIKLRTTWRSALTRSRESYEVTFRRLPN